MVESAIQITSGITINADANAKNIKRYLKSCFMEL